MPTQKRIMITIISIVLTSALTYLTGQFLDRYFKIDHLTEILPWAIVILSIMALIAIYVYWKVADFIKELKEKISLLNQLITNVAATTAAQFKVNQINKPKDDTPQIFPQNDASEFENDDFMIEYNNLRAKLYRWTKTTPP